MKKNETASSEVQKQRDYYKAKARHYDSTWAFDPNDEHFIATAALDGLLKHFKVQSLLDVGCGSGRSLDYLRKLGTNVKLHGIDPVEALVEECYAKGFTADEVSLGDACNLKFADSSFDCVTAFGVLHHIPEPKQAIEEMIRVAGKCIFISDHNIYGMGSPLTRRLKQTFRDLGMKPLLRTLMTRGKGFHDTDWDGVFYPFSLVDHVELIKKYSQNCYLFSTKTPSVNLYRESSHIAILAELKK